MLPSRGSQVPPQAESDTAPATCRRSTWRVVVGALWLLVALYCAARSWGSLLTSHPAYLVTLALVLVVGVLFVLTGLRRVRADRHRHVIWTAIGRVAGALGTLALLSSLVYLIPFTASPAAVEAMAGTSAVRVESSPTRIVLTPTDKPARAGLVFQPGARVDPRAYVPLLTPVSEAGYLVTIVKQPFDIGFLAITDPGNVVDANPGISRWAVGGHSLGGVAASSYAGLQGSRANGVVFWASYPLGSLADRTDLVVVSLSGTADGLSTPADIEASRANLPPSTVFTPVHGAVHAYFGDYGEQPGDGTPSVDRPTAQRQIVAATIAFLERLTQQ